uniref:BTB domain-containing protein n=1 Tax=Acanthochromis polyacanthus TaxID=80966 RepID=A0A3Q1EYZ8_9TELE
AAESGDSRSTKPFHRNQKRGADTESKPGSKAPSHHKDSGFFSYILPSHSNTIFAHLHHFWMEELLVDCTFPLQGNSFRAHRLVLAASSQTPAAVLGTGMEEMATCLTPVGLRAILEFAYCGDVTMDLNRCLQDSSELGGGQP